VVGALPGGGRVRVWGLPGARPSLDIEEVQGGVGRRSVAAYGDPLKLHQPSLCQFVNHDMGFAGEPQFS
jgi:hypothetical protein